jgi:two-component system, OmpR family, response regulator
MVIRNLQIGVAADIKVSSPADMLVMSPVPKRKVLFVDDDKDWRDVVTASLGAAGFDVVAAADGSEAMLRAADPSLGLMIVDEDLAGESGRMLTWFLRHNHPGVPTMLYTTAEREADATPNVGGQSADQILPKGSMEELIVNVGCYLG